jgi:hypothetical protein
VSAQAQQADQQQGRRERSLELDGEVVELAQNGPAEWWAHRGLLAANLDGAIYVIQTYR